MSDYIAAFEDFQKALKKDINANLNDSDKNTIGRIWAETNNFLTTYGLTNTAIDPSNIGQTITGALETANVMNNVGVHGLKQFVESCGIDKDLAYSACEAVMFNLTAPESKSIHAFFTNKPNTVNNSSLFFKASDYIGNSLNKYSADYSAALEDFGKNTDMLQSDLRLSTAITLIKYHKGVMDRLMRRKPTTEHVVRFDIEGAEVYDLNDVTTTTKGNQNLNYVGTPYIDLYKTPETVNTSLKKVIPLKANDTGPEPVLIEDDVMLFNKEISTMTMAMKDAIGYDQVDFSDLIADAVTLGKVRFPLTKAGGTPVTEVFEFDFSSYAGARFLMPMQARHSADRVMNLQETLVLNDAFKTIAGATSTILADFTGNYVIDLKLIIDGNFSLFTGNAFCRFTPFMRLRSIDGSAIPADVQTAFNSISVDITGAGYSLEEYWDESNTRKTSQVIRIARGSMAYEIPLTKNIMVDYAIDEVRPEQAIGMVAEALSLGNDARGVDIAITQIKKAYDRIQNEKVLHKAGARDGIRYDYPAGLKVNPYIRIVPFKLVDYIKNEWSGQTLGDVRGAVDKFFLELFSDMHSASLYTNSLNNGEKIVYRVCTSGPIKENLFNIPHYHNHLNDNGAVDGDIEYRRVLPSGVVMDIFTVSWDMMADTMLIVPYRTGDADTVTNFGYNADRGSFVANLDVRDASAHYKRIITNSKESPIVTNPYAALVNVSGVSELLTGNLSIM